MVNHLTGHDRWDSEIGGDVNDLVAQIARMGGAQFAVAFDVPFLQQVGQTLVVIFDILGLGHAPEDFTEFFVRWVADFDFMAQAAQEGFVHQVAGWQVG